MIRPPKYHSRNRRRKRPCVERDGKQRVAPEQSHRSWGRECDASPFRRKRGARQQRHIHKALLAEAYLRLSSEERRCKVGKEGTEVCLGICGIIIG